MVISHNPVRFHRHGCGHCSVLVNLAGRIRNLDCPAMDELFLSALHELAAAR